jgi:hypothetical protein
MVSDFETTTREGQHPNFALCPLSLSLSRARKRTKTTRDRSKKTETTTTIRVCRNKTRTFRAVQGEMPLENIILQRLRPRGERVRVGVQLRFCVCELFHLLRDATDGGVVRRRRRGGHRIRIVFVIFLCVSLSSDLIRARLLKWRGDFRENFRHF